MHKVVITADSTADLPPELIERYDIRIIPLTVILGEDSYLDGENIDPAAMFARCRSDGILPKTAAPSVQAFNDFFGEILSSGDSIVHLDISSELSNAYNAARLAASETENVYVVDSRSLCCGIALLAVEGAECRDRGMSAAEIAGHLNSITGKVSASFVLDTLEFIWKGGRCSGITALGANLLNIRPALEVREGVLSIGRKYRGTRRSVWRKYLIDQMGGKKLRGHVFLADSGEIEPDILEEMEALVRELAGDCTVHRAKAGCTICGHCGPGTLAVFFMEE